MKALVLSGGGAKGAYAGGMLEYLKLELKKDYDMYLGTSTGSLLQTLASIDNFESLKVGYTSMGLNDIYDISPFKKINNPEEADQTGLNGISILRTHLFRGEPTFGINEGFRETIKKFFPYEKYLEVCDSGVNLTATVTNISKVRTEYYDIKSLGRDENSYEDFIDWTWISTLAVPFTSIARRLVSDGRIIHRGEHEVIYVDYYGDGGFMEHMPISKAIEEGATEIDAITTTTEKYSGDLEPDFGRNPLKLLARLFDITLRESMDKDIENAKKMAKEKDVVLNVYHFPRKITDNSMYFDKEQMSGWWNEGYEYIKSLDEKNQLKKACKTIKMKAKKRSSK